MILTSERNIFPIWSSMRSKISLSFQSSFIYMLYVLLQKFKLPCKEIRSKNLSPSSHARELSIRARIGRTKEICKLKFKWDSWNSCGSKLFCHLALTSEQKKVVAECQKRWWVSLTIVNTEGIYDSFTSSSKAF